MKTVHPFIALALAMAAPAGAQAAGYTRAELTRLHNEVKVLKENAAPRDASVGDQIDTVTSVATGAGSRAELKFPDNSLTRLGANSRFTLRGDQRTLDLDQGVMLLQVPKKLGGAKVRTAAVTAAVTGTTVLFEYLPGGFVKLIVIEGVVDLYFNNDPSKFTNITAGQMIIMKTDSKTLPAPVDVDLSLLLKTSKLINGDDKSMPNFMEVARALSQQQKELKNGDLVATNFVLPGRGTLVELSNDTRLNVFKTVGIKDGAPPQNPSSNPGGGNGHTPGNNPNPGQTFTGYVPLITGTSYLGEYGFVETNPHVTVDNSVTGPETRFEGRLYDANPDTEVNPGFVPFPYFAFGSGQPVENVNFQDFLAGYFGNSAGFATDSYYYCPPDQRWAVFKFEELIINGTPYFDFPITTFVADSPVGNVIFSAVNDLTLTEPPDSPYYYSHSFDVTDSFYYGELDKVVFYSQYGDVNLGYGFKVKGAHQDFAFVAAGVQSDVNLIGSVSTDGNVLVSAGQDVLIMDKVKGKVVDIAAGRDINLEFDGESNSGKIKAKDGLELRARRSIKISDTSSLKMICANEDAVMKLLAQGGNIDIGTEGGGYYRAQLSGPNIDIEAVDGNGLPGHINIHNADITAANVLRARTVGPDGWITIGNSNLTAETALKLYAEGDRGGVRFVANSSLTGDEVHIAGRTVEITGGVTVDVNSNSANVYADEGKRLFRVNGTGDVNRGNFNVRDRTGSPGTLNQSNFNQKPNY